MAIFLVTHLTADKLIGMVSTPTTILHNLQIISPEYKDKFIKELNDSQGNFLIQIVCIGRYLTYIQLSKDKTKGVMMFIDAQNDYDKALSASSVLKNHTKDPYYLNWFMEEFEKMAPHYAENYNAAELMVSSDAGFMFN